MGEVEVGEGIGIGNALTHFVLQELHSQPQRLHSIWSAPRAATSGLVQHRKSMIHRIPVKSGKSY